MAELPEDAASAPKRFSGDTGSVESHDLDKMIEFDRYQKTKEAQANSGSAFAGLRMTGCSHPSTR